MDNPSDPPRSESTTTTLPPLVAPYATCRKASPNMLPTANVPAPAAAVASRRRRDIVNSGQPQASVFAAASSRGVKV